MIKRKEKNKDARLNTLKKVSDKVDKLLKTASEKMYDDCDITKIAKLVSVLDDAIAVKRNLYDIPSGDDSRSYELSLRKLEMKGKPEETVDPVITVNLGEAEEYAE